MGRYITTDDAADGSAAPGLGRRAGYALVGGTLAALAYRGLRRRNTPDRGDDAFLEESRTETRTGAGEDADAGTDTADASTVTSAVTVVTSADEAYETWTAPETQAQIFGEFADVIPAGEDRWKWNVDAPLGRSLSWETRTVEDRPGELVRWEAVDGSALVPEGSVRFSPAPADRGTEVRLRLRVDPPGGSLGRAAMERLDVLPKALANEVLYRFRSLVEAGEIPTLKGNPSGRGRGDLL